MLEVSDDKGENDEYYTYVSNNNDNYYDSKDEADDYYSSIPFQYRPTTTTSHYWESFRLLQWIEYITRPKMAVLMAILVLIYFHFQASIHAWLDYYFPPHVSWSESFSAMFWQGADWLRGHFYQCLELVRNLRLYGIHNNTATVAAHLRNRPFTETTTSPTKERQQHYYNQHGSSSSFLSQIPELEQVSKDDTLLPDTIIRTDTGVQRRFQQKPLPPAFEKDEDYPIGWMVYHATLGVVSKTEADAFNNAATTIKGDTTFTQSTEQDTTNSQGHRETCTQEDFEISNGEENSNRPIILRQQQQQQKRAVVVSPNTQVPTMPVNETLIGEPDTPLENSFPVAKNAKQQSYGAMMTTLESNISSPVSTSQDGPEGENSLVGKNDNWSTPVWKQHETHSITTTMQEQKRMEEDNNANDNNNTQGTTSSLLRRHTATTLPSIAANG